MDFYGNHVDEVIVVISAHENAHMFYASSDAQHFAHLQAHLGALGE